MVLCVVDVDLPAPRRDGDQGTILGVLHVRYPRLSATHLATKTKPETIDAVLFFVHSTQRTGQALQGQLLMHT